MESKKSTAKKSNLVAIITMFFIFAMISFVTNMAAPFGNIWGFRYEWAGMAGNLMNFTAYLFMGIPAGNMLIKYGYKKTALIALAVGAIGLSIQLASAYVGADVVVIGGANPTTLNLLSLFLGSLLPPLLLILDPPRRSPISSAVFCFVKNNNAL